jgi:hypothetical protein
MITHQSYRGIDFYYGRVFHASNGVYLTSESYPAHDSSLVAPILYVRGIDWSKDDYIIRIPVIYINGIINAIEEYNNIRVNSL